MERRNKRLFLIWGILFIVSAPLGFIQQPVGLLKALLVLLSIGFFAPGALLLYYGAKEWNIAVLRCIRTVSLISLCATFVLLLGNFCAVFLSDAAGVFLYVLLGIVSAPMLCSQFWALSLFLWASLLMTSFLFIHKAKTV